MKARDTFYKKKYMIALYDDEDDLIVVVDNIRQLVASVGQEVNKDTLNNMMSRVSYAIEKNRPLRWYGRWAHVYLIDATE